MINLTDQYFMTIEPNQDGLIADEPINDELTEKVKFIYDCTVMPDPMHRYKGEHYIEVKKTNDGIRDTIYWICSDNADHYLPNGVITNSLCVFYVQYYRLYIPQIEIDKINKYYEMCKIDPSKKYKQSWERSATEEIVIHKRVEETEEERRIRREKDMKRWAKEDKIRAKKVMEEYRRKEKSDKRSQFFKEGMKRAGFPLQYK